MIKRVGITQDDVLRVNQHATLARFGWSTVDVPRALCEPVLAQVDKPLAHAMHAIDWFAEAKARRR